MTLRLRGGRTALAWTVGLLAVCLGGSVRLAWSQVTVGIPLLPPGKSIVVTIDATVHTSLPAGVMQVSTQSSLVGEVGGVPFRLLTDDPSGPGVPPRPTVTRLDVQTGPPDPLLLVTLGDASPPPQPPRMVSPPVTDFAVLQVQVETGAEAVRLTTLTLDLMDVHGDEALLQRLHLAVMHDANANGRADADEEDLASTLALTGDARLRLAFLTPLRVSAESSVHLLVVLTAADGSTSPRSVPLSVLPPGMPPWLGLGLGLMAAVAAYVWRRHSHRPLRMVAVLLFCTLGCGLVLTSCDGSGEVGEEMLSATVVLPTDGLTGDSETSGLVHGPTAPLLGASVIIRP